jgi:hypothetical protein
VNDTPTPITQEGLNQLKALYGDQVLAVIELKLQVAHLEAREVELVATLQRLYDQYGPPGEGAAPATPDSGPSDSEGPLPFKGRRKPPEAAGG